MKRVVKKTVLASKYVKITDVNNNVTNVDVPAFFKELQSHYRQDIELVHYDDKKIEWNVNGIECELRLGSISDENQLHNEIYRFTDNAIRYY